MIQIENLTYHYPDSIDAALRSINLTIKKGELISVMGSNGSGKSTLAKILSKILKPDRGNLQIGENDEAVVGFVFQNPDNQMVALTVEKELAFGLENLGTPIDLMDTKINEVLKSFELTSLRDRIISDLSGGEKQRVAVASVMISNPQILIFDEPDSFLDHHGRKILLKQIANIKKSNPEIIIIHITQFKEIANLYPRMLLLHNGEIVDDDSPVKLFSNNELMHFAGFTYQTNNMNLESLVQPQSNDSKSVQVENLSFQYDAEKEILHNISFSLSQGEIIGVIGQSGSGKSTLAALLTGLIPQFDGSIHIVPKKLDEKVSNHVTMLFQQPEKQFFLQTVKDEIEFGLKNKNIKISNQQIIDIMNLVGLNYKKLAKRNPQTLSGGEKRRLAFAVILALSYNFIIFDEPTCGLDLQGVSMFSELISNLRFLHKGIIVISHDFDMLQSVSDKIIYLHTNGTAEYFSQKQFFESQIYSQIQQSHKNIKFFS